ncbi:MAG: sulfotransferase [Anaerolineales bacterium]|nr:sulfotransferase [Anaerolineales bacterium]
MAAAEHTTRPLLVTGAHRSGTTWVGKMLAQGGDFAYVSEPLNVWHRPGVMRAPVEHWYTYICEDNEAQYLDALQETSQLKYHLGREFLSLRSAKDAGRMLRDGSIFTRGRLQGQRALLKDPFAVFSAPWFAEKLNCQVVVTVRHPAAFASSLKRLGWTFNFWHLLIQPELMRDHLEPYRTAMEVANLNAGDLILRAALLWRMIYAVVWEYSQTHTDIQVVRHEDLSLEPLTAYESLYAALGIDYNQRARDGIRQATSAENPSEVSRDAIYSVNLDSRANLKNWKKRLTPEEIERIRELTTDVAGHYYNDEDWI